MARPGDTEDTTRGTGDDDYASDPPEFRRDTEGPIDEGEQKRPLIDRARERVQKAAGALRATITSGIESLTRRAQSESVEQLGPVDPNGFLEEAQKAENILGKIVEEVNDGTMDAATARQNAEDLNANLLSGYQAQVKGPVKRFISWLKGVESQADAERVDSAGSEEGSHGGAETEAVAPPKAAQGAPLSRLGEIAQKGIDRVFGRKAEAGEFSDEGVERLLAGADSRIAASKSGLQNEYWRMESRLRSLHNRAGTPETEDQRRVVDTLLYSLRGRWSGVSFVEFTSAETALQEDIWHKRSGANQRFEETIKTIEDDFHTFLAGIDKKVTPLDGGFDTNEQGARERLLTEAESRVQTELDVMQKKVDQLMARIDSALALPRTVSYDQSREVDGIKTSLSARHQQFQKGIRSFLDRLRSMVENKTQQLPAAERDFNTIIQSTVDLLNDRITLFERRLDAILSEAEAAAGAPPPPEGPIAENLSDAERSRLEQGIEDADFLVGVVDVVDDRFTHALTELNRLNDQILRSDLKYQLDLNHDRLIGMRNAVGNARDVLKDELNGGKKGGDKARALSVVDEHYAPRSEFYSRHAKFNRAVAMLEDALSAQDRAVAPAAEVPATAGSGAKPAAGPTVEVLAGGTFAPEAPAPAPEAVTLPPDVQKNLADARFVLKLATDTDDAYLERIKDFRGDANNLSEDESHAIQSFQIACSGIRDALDNAEAILKGDTFRGNPQRLNERAADAYAALAKLKTLPEIANDLSYAAGLLELNLPTTIEPVLAAARAKVEQDSQEKMRTSIQEGINEATREYNALTRRIPREFDNLAVLDKAAPDGGTTTVIDALSQIYDLIKRAQIQEKEGNFSDAQLTLRLVNEAWIQPLSAVIDGEIAAARAATEAKPGVSGDAVAHPPFEAPAAGPDLSGGAWSSPTVEAPTVPVPGAPDAGAGAPPPGVEAGDPIEGMMDSARKIIDAKLGTFEYDLNTLLSSLTGEQRDWTLRKHGALLSKAENLRITEFANALRATEDKGKHGKALDTLLSDVDKLIADFPLTQEAISTAMAAEEAVAAGPAKGPEASPVAGMETPEAPGITAEKTRLTARWQMNRDGVRTSARMLEAKCAGNPDLKSSLGKLNAQITRDFDNVGADLLNSKTVEDIGKAERRIGEAYGNLIDKLATLAEYAGSTIKLLEMQKKMTELETENASSKTRMEELEARIQAFIDAQASGGTPTGPGAGGPGAPGGPTGPGGGPTPPPGGSGPTGPGGPASPEPGAPEDPEKAQAEAIKTELESTLIPEIQTALAGRDYLLDVKVLLTIKRPENPGAINTIEMPLEAHINFVNDAPAKIDRRLAADTLLKARQVAQDAKVHAESIIKFLQEPLSPEAEQRAVEALRQRFIRTGAEYQRNIETANNDLLPRTMDLMYPMGIDTAPLRALFERTGETFNQLEDLFGATPPDLSAIAETYRNFQIQAEEVAQEVARLQQEVADGTIGARAQRAAGAVRDAGGAAVRAVRDAGPRAARAVGRADREWGRRIERGLDRSGRADSFEDRARRFFHGLGERFRSNLVDRMGLGFNSAIIAFHERGVEDIALRTDALREEIVGQREDLAEFNRILDPSNPDGLTPGEIATERREYNRLVRELGDRQRDLDRDLGTLERRRAAAQPYFDARQDIATDAKLRLEQYTGERAARYDAAQKRSGQIHAEVSAAESDRDKFSAEIQTLRLSLHTERRALRAGLRRQITRMESQLRSMNREIGPQRRVLATLNNDIASLAPHVTYWRDQVLPEFTRFSREPVPVNHGDFGPREVPGLDTTRHSTRPTATTPDSFSAPVVGGGGGGGGPEVPAAAPDAAAGRPAGIESGDESITISPRDIAEALFRKWGSQIGVASADGMTTEMQKFITATPRFAAVLDQKFQLSQLRDFITAFNQHLNANDFNRVDVRTLRTLTRDLRSRAGGAERAAA